MRYFVSRHEGAIQWAKKQQLAIDAWQDHFDVDQAQAGDVVYGTLPIPMVAQLMARGARYFHLSFEMPKELRGRELTAEEMDQLQVSLVEYRVEAL